MRHHKVNPASGEFIPDAPKKALDPFSEAKKILGINSASFHTPWEEEGLVRALMDWVVMTDLPFMQAASPELRGIIS
jgi:hypothetical protein